MAMNQIVNPAVITCLAAAGLLAGCAGAPQLYEVKSVYVCAAEECGQAGQRFSSSQMLRALHRLIRANDGQEFRICASDPKTRSCESEGVAYFVMGGPIPGRGGQASGRMSAPVLDMTTQTIGYRMASNLTFNGVPLACAEHDGRVTVRSADEIAMEDSPFYCNWMAVGNMTATFSLAIEAVDLDRGRLGGYWSHAVAGTGNGKGGGYAIIQFSNVMPRGENWLGE